MRATRGRVYHFAADKIFRRSDGTPREGKKKPQFATATFVITSRFSPLLSASYNGRHFAGVSFHVGLTIYLVCFRNTSAKDRRCETACRSAWRKVSATAAAAAYSAVVKQKRSRRYNLFRRSRFACFFPRDIGNSKSIRPPINSLAPLGRPMAGISQPPGPIDEIYSG